MPNRDRTGPEGEGPMTGRQAGPCARTDVSTPGNPGRRFAGRPYGGRRGRGRRTAGRGWRRRNRVYAADTWGGLTQTSEGDALKVRAERLRGELDAIDQRLQELNQDK
jgi:hypothetical protein